MEIVIVEKFDKPVAFMGSKFQRFVTNLLGAIVGALPGAGKAAALAVAGVSGDERECSGYLHPAHETRYSSKG